ncbi:hypothetical protein P8C59_004409 [Phyllachora maydis]|uniref:Uncharacterized protein n=1 Tax=Phyllachora maydis TaxID=1825666 RepID=A0AAD9I3A6_9PEZI|nr:hypothetical protein P8C59_004409 [Phyllachora maydis]
MALLSRLLAAVTATATATALALAAPLAPRGAVGSKDIVGLPQTVPAGPIGDLYLAYQPYLDVVNGCVPFPAVDAAGNTNRGLKRTGSPSGDCSSSTGQVYVRGGASGGKYVLMYSWYMPKDSPSPGLGHRHDWEGVLIWLSVPAGDPASLPAITPGAILAVCPSAHGGWACAAAPAFTLSGTAALVKYKSVWPRDHACGLTGTVGARQPLVAWESLTGAQRAALQETDFGSANVPFKDGSWEGNLAGAKF